MNYQELALRSESPVGEETLGRYLDNYIQMMEALVKLKECLADCDFDYLKRKIFYGPSGEHIPEPSRQELRVTHALLGKLSELYELMDALNITEDYETPDTSDVIEYDKVNVLEEIGDDSWYNALLLDALGIELKESLKRNIAKLAVRYPEKFNIDLSKNRNLDRERRHLSGDLETEILNQLGLNE